MAKPIYTDAVTVVAHNIRSDIARERVESMCARKRDAQSGEINRKTTEDAAATLYSSAEDGDAPEQSDNFSFDDIDFGITDEELLSAFKPTRKPSRNLDFGETLDSETTIIGDLSENTTVLSAIETTAPGAAKEPPDKTTIVANVSAKQDLPTTTSASQPIVQEPSEMGTTVLAENNADPGTTVLSEGMSKQGESSSPPKSAPEQGTSILIEKDEDPETTVVSDASTDPDTTVLADAPDSPGTSIALEATSATISQDAPKNPNTEVLADDAGRLTDQTSTAVASMFDEGTVDPDPTAVSGSLSESNHSTHTSDQNTTTISEKSAASPDAKTSHEPEPALDDSHHDSSGERDERRDKPASNRNKFAVAGVAGVAAIMVLAFVLVGIPALGTSSETSQGESATQEAASTQEAQEEATPETHSLYIEYLDTQTKATLKSPHSESFEEGDYPSSVSAAEISGYAAIKGSDNGDKQYTRKDFDQGLPALISFSDGGTQDHSVVFSYAKFVGHTARYLESGTDAEVSPAKVVTGELSGDTTTEHAIEIDGYNLVSEADLSITLTDDDAANVITFYYEKKPVETPVETSTQTYTQQNNTYSQPSTGTTTTPSTPSTPVDDPVDGNWGSTGKNAPIDGNW